MAISLLVTHPDTGREDELVPVATQDVFNRYWLPAARQLDLKWVPSFQPSLDLEHEELATVLPDLLEELGQLRRLMAVEPPSYVPREQARAIAARIDGLSAALERALRDPDAEIDIG